MKRTKVVEILTNRDFLLVWGAQIISMLGNWTYYVAIAAVLYDMTQSGRGIAILRSLQTGALLVMAPIAGIIVDRFHRKRIMVFSDLSRAAVLLVLLVAPPKNPIIYLVGIALTVLSVLFGSAETAILPDIVDKGDLVTANSLTSTTQNLMLIAGGAVGGTIVASGGYRLAFLLDILTFVVSAALLSFVRGKSAITGEAIVFFEWVRQCPFSCSQHFCHAGKDRPRRPRKGFQSSRNFRSRCPLSGYDAHWTRRKAC